MHPHLGPNTNNRLPNAVMPGTLGLASPLSASISQALRKGEGDVHAWKLGTSGSSGPTTLGKPAPSGTSDISGRSAAESPWLPAGEDLGI